MKVSIATFLLASLITVRAATPLEVPEVLRETGATLSSDKGQVTFSVRSKSLLDVLRVCGDVSASTGPHSWECGEA